MAVFDLVFDYDDDPICILYAPDEESPEGYIDPTVLIEKPSTPTMGGGRGRSNPEIKTLTCS